MADTRSRLLLRKNVKIMVTYLPFRHAYSPGQHKVLSLSNIVYAWTRFTFRLLLFLSQIGNFLLGVHLLSLSNFVSTPIQNLVVLPTIDGVFLFLHNFSYVSLFGYFVVLNVANKLP
jgi:hypothetical protein